MIDLVQKALCLGACLLCAAGAVIGAPPAAESPLLPPVEYVAQQPREAIPVPAPEAPAGLTLADVEAMALSCNPAIAEAAAQVRAAQGQYMQVGLPPNPTVGYLGSEIGNEGTAGQNGVIVGQEFIRGKKLELNRAVESREVLKRRQALAAQLGRLTTDVRIAFYEAYVAQRRVELSRDLQTVGRQSAATANMLLEAAEGRRTDLLQAEIESQRASIDLAQAESNFRGAWRRLGLLVGRPDMPVEPLAANVESLRWSCSWEQTVDRLLESSPEVSEAVAAVEKARWTLSRARVEPIPDVTAQASVQYDDASNDTIAGAQVTLPIPLWNRNQGGVARAQAEVTAAQFRLESVQLRLEQRLTSQYQQYETSLARVDALKGQILDRAQQNLDVATQAYGAGELGFLDFLTVQRTYFQANLEYLAALGELNRSVQMLEGLLLSGAYEHAANAPTP